MDHKEAILAALEVMRTKSIADKEVFKARAYAKVASQIKGLPVVRSYDDVASITGIGEKIRDKIHEILATGSLRAAEKAKADYHLDATEAFLKIYGVGPAKAKEIVDAGILTIADLRAEFARLEALPAKAKKPKYFNDLTRIGLRYYEPLLERIPREEMLQHQTLIGSKMPAVFQSEIVGSFRRQAATSGDIDVLIRAPPVLTEKKCIALFAKYIADLTQCGYIAEVLAEGYKKCMAICAVAPGKFRRLDLLMTPPEEYPYAILYFTGSDKFNIAFRHHALARGYTLNEHDMHPLDPAITSIAPQLTSEEDIFRFLGLKYIPPHERVDATQIIPLTQ
jgi:DNA polymerase beta